jgi:hypothetical protein
LIGEIIISDTELPVFPMVRGETFFTDRDLADLKKSGVPYPSDTKGINDLFFEFANDIGAEFQYLEKLARSEELNPFRPRPCLLNSGMWEEHGQNFPPQFHSLIKVIWLAQLDDLLKKIYGKIPGYLTLK